MRKIAIVTGTRAEYGLLYWVIKAVHDDRSLVLQLVVAGAHLSPEFGHTAEEIEADRFLVADRVEMTLSSDTKEAVATSMGLGVIGFTKAFSRLSPDVVVVAGDRVEALSAALAAVPLNIPVAHIHGGETTEGAMDEYFRHAITKLGAVHFASTELHARRIRQMGEDPQMVFSFGAPGLDSIKRTAFLSRKELSDKLSLPEDMPWGVVTYHPETRDEDTVENRIGETLGALGRFEDVCWVFTQPNADAGWRAVEGAKKAFVAERPGRAFFFASLGRRHYMSLLGSASLMVGNSSSGIIEAPSFRLPVVNIGQRQAGRTRAANVIDVPFYTSGEIADAVKEALSREFRESLKALENPYGDGTASERIVEALKGIELSGLAGKRFFEVKTP